MEENGKTESVLFTMRGDAQEEVFSEKQDVIMATGYWPTSTRERANFFLLPTPALGAIRQFSSLFSFFYDCYSFFLACVYSFSCSQEHLRPTSSCLFRSAQPQCSLFPPLELLLSQLIPTLYFIILWY